MRMALLNNTGVPYAEGQDLRGPLVRASRWERERIRRAVGRFPAWTGPEARAERRLLIAQQTALQVSCRGRVSDAKIN